MDNLQTFLQNCRIDIFNHINWGTLTTPTLIQEEEDLMGRGIFPSVDIFLENFIISDERFNSSILDLQFDITIFLAVLQDLEKYIQRIINSFMKIPSFLSNVYDIKLEIGREQDIKFAMVKISVKTQVTTN